MPPSRRRPARRRRFFFGVDLFQAIFRTEPRIKHAAVYYVVLDNKARYTHIAVV